MSSGSNGITVPKLISSSCESAETFGGWQLKWDAWERTKNRTRWSGAACLVKRTKNKQEDSRIWTVSSSLPPPPVTQLHTDRRVISLPALFHRSGLLLFLWHLCCTAYYNEFEDHRCSGCVNWGNWEPQCDDQTWSWLSGHVSSSKQRTRDRGGNRAHWTGEKELAPMALGCNLFFAGFRLFCS